MRRRRLLMPLVFALVVVAAVWWALTPMSLTAEEHPLVGRWTVDGLSGTLREVRADRTWWCEGEFSGRWQVRDGVLRLVVADPPGRSIPDRLQVFFYADRPATVTRVVWDGPDQFRLYADVLDSPQAGDGAHFSTYRRVP